MNTFNDIKRLISRGSGVAGMAFLLILTACDTTSVLENQDATGGLDVPAAALVEGLNLSDADARQVADVLGKYDTDEPGRLWYASAELQETLTEEQKTALLANLDEAPEGPGGARGARLRGGKMMGREGGPMEEMISGLTEEQKAQMKALHEEQGETLRALVKQRRDGSLSEDQFKAETTKIREEIKLAMAEILTPEQLQELEEKRAAMQEKVEARRGDRQRDESGTRSSRVERRSEQRDVIEVAMVDALELTDEQQTQLKEIHEQSRAQMEALRGEDRETARESLESLRASLRESHESILTDKQNEIVAIHRALSNEVRSRVRSKFEESAKTKRAGRG